MTVSDLQATHRDRVSRSTHAATLSRCALHSKVHAAPFGLYATHCAQTKFRGA